jgi:hypothetical protein
MKKWGSFRCEDLSFYKTSTCRILFFETYYLLTEIVFLSIGREEISR